MHVNQFVYALLAEEKCREADVEIAYYEFPEAVVKTDAGWQVDCIGFGTRRQVKCKQIIDCTGGAEVVGLLGFERLREEERQPDPTCFSWAVRMIPPASSYTACTCMERTRPIRAPQP